MNITNLITNLKQATMAADSFKSITNTYVGTGFDAVIDSNTIIKYTNSIKGLTLEQAKLALSTTKLSTYEKNLILTKAGLIAETDKLTAKQTVATLQKELGNKTDAKKLLLQSGLITQTELEENATIQVTVAKLEEAVANGLLTVEQSKLIASIFGVTGANYGEAVSFEVLTKAIWANIAAMAKWLVTNPVGWAILATGAIAGTVAIFNALTVSAEEAKKAQDDLASTFDNLTNEVSQLSSHVDELIPEYARLSKGVNSLGENVSLTTEEYERYQEVVNQIADDVPSVIAGYDAEGNAIINLKNNVDELKQAYIEARKEKYNLALAEEIENAADAISYYQSLVNTTFGDGYLNLVSRNFANISELDAYETLKKALMLSYDDFFKELGSDSSELFDKNSIDYLKTFDIIDDIANAEDFEKLRIEFKRELTELESELDVGLQSIKNIANMYLLSSDDYYKLDENMQKLSSIIVNNLTHDVASELKDKNKVGNFIVNLLDTLSSATPEVHSAFNSLMNLDISGLDTETAKSEVDKYLDIIIDELGDELSLDKNQLKLMFGLDEKSINNITDTVDQDVIPTISDLTTSYDTFNEKIKETIDLQNKLVDAFQKVANGEKFNASEVYDLISEIPELANYLRTLDDGGFTFSADGINLINDNLIADEKAKIQAEIDKARQIVDEYNRQQYKMARIVEKYGDAGKNFINTFGIENKYEEQGVFREDAEEALKTVEKYTILQGILDSIFNKHQMTLDGIDEKYNTAKSSVDDYNNSIKSIDSAIDKMNEKQALTYDEMVELVEISPELENSFTEQENGYYIAINALDELKTHSYETRDEYIDNLIAIAKAEQTASATIETEVQSRIKSYQDWVIYGVEVAKELAELQVEEQKRAEYIAKLEGLKNSLYNDSSSDGGSGNDETITAFEKELKYLDYLRDMGMISAKEYYKQLYFLNEKYYSDNEKYLEQYRDNEVKIRDGITDIEIRAIDRQIEALEALQEKREEEKELQELQVELEEKKLELLNKQSQKNVRYYDAEKREWIWTYNREDVADAQKAVDEAQDALDEHLYQSNEDKKIEQLEQIKEFLQGDEDNPNNPVQFVGSEGVTTLATGRSVTFEEFVKSLGATQPIDTTKFWNAIYSTGLQPNVQKIAESTHNQNYQTVNRNVTGNNFNVTINGSNLSAQELEDVTTKAFENMFSQLLTQASLRMR